MPFETHSREKLTRLAILKKNRGFLQKNSSIFQKTQISNVLRLLKQCYDLRRILEKKIATFSNFETFQGFFAKKTSIFPEKKPKF